MLLWVCWLLPHLPYLILVKLELLPIVIAAAPTAAAACTVTTFANEKLMIPHVSNVLGFNKGPVSAEQRASCSTCLVILYQNVYEVAT
jgi:hypothetical protein